MPWYTTHTNAVDTALLLTAQETGNRWFDVVPCVGIAGKWRVVVRHLNSRQNDYFVFFDEHGAIIIEPYRSLSPSVLNYNRDDGA